MSSPQWPANSLSVRDGRLFVDDCDAAELVAQHGSPLYVLSEPELRHQIVAWNNALTRAWPTGPTRLLPSVKANTALAVQRIVRDMGCGADTFGANEYEITRRAGFDPSLVSVNGQKNVELITSAVADGARLTIDNIAELSEIREAARTLGVTAKVRIRLRPALTEWNQPADLMVEDIPTWMGMGAYKPGVSVDQLLQLSSTDFGDDVQLVGVHAHVARISRDPQYWEIAARDVIGLVALLRDRLEGWTPHEIDMGGGFPSSMDTVGQQIPRVRDKYAGVAVPPPIDYTTAIARGLGDAAADHGIDLAGTLLEIEPGRGLFGPAGIHLSTVVRRKSQSSPFEHHWVELDTSVVHFSVEEHNEWEVVVANRAADAHAITADVVGCSCQLDQIVGSSQLPDVTPGDIIAFLDAGAYQETGASNFNALSRPPIVIVDGTTSRVIRRRETIDDILQRDVDTVVALDTAQSMATASGAGQ